MCLKKADKNGGCQILPLKLKGCSVNSSYSFTDVQVILYCGWFCYKTIFGALKILGVFGVKLGAPGFHNRYAVCQVILWHKFRVRFLTSSKSSISYQHVPDLQLLQRYGP